MLSPGVQIPHSVSGPDIANVCVAHPVIWDGSGRRARHQTQSGSAVGCEPVVPLDYVGIRVSHMAKVVLVNNRTGNALSKPFTMSRRHEGREPGWRRSGRCERAHNTDR